MWSQEGVDVFLRVLRCIGIPPHIINGYAPISRMATWLIVITVTVSRNKWMDEQTAEFLEDFMEFCQKITMNLKASSKVQCRAWTPEQRGLHKLIDRTVSYEGGVC